MQLAIMIEGQDGLNWPRWQRIVRAVEDAGFAGLFRSDHFTNSQPPEKDSLEMIVSLSYLATTTRRIHFGPLVAPVSFRDPVLLARQAAALDDLSGGRHIIGLGAGWNEREHRLFGYTLGDTQTRLARLEEGLEVVTRLLRSDVPVSYHGRFFRLDGAILLPRPNRPGGPPILIGGNGPKRTLPLVARYADYWNAIALAPAVFRERSVRLDDLLRQAGRQPGDVRRTMMNRILFARQRGELDELLRKALGQRQELKDAPLDERLAAIRAAGSPIVGTSDMVLEQIQALAEAGVEELMLQWFELDDVDRLRDFGAAVLPALS